MQSRDNEKCVNDKNRRRSIILNSNFMGKILLDSFWNSFLMDEAYQYDQVKRLVHFLFHVVNKLTRCS